MLLVIDKSRKNAEIIVNAFRYMGVLAKAETPNSALSEISMLYRGVLIINPSKLPDPKEYVKTLRSYAGMVPIFAISDSDLPYYDCFEATFSETITSAKLFKAIVSFCEGRKLPIVGEYKFAGMNISVDMPCAIYFNDVIRFTKTEALIVRLFIRMHPIKLSLKQILKYVFPRSNYPEEASIRSHISSINKKFRAVAERNLIESLHYHGYSIITPIMLNKLKRDSASQ